MQFHLAVDLDGRCLAYKTAGDPVTAAGARGPFLPRPNQAMFPPAHGNQPARDAARLGVCFIDQVANALRFRGLRRLFLLKAIAEDIQEISDGGQLLADAVMQVVSDTPLLASADFPNLTLTSPALGDVARDAFDFHNASLLLDQARADLQFDSLVSRADEVPFRRGHLGALNDLIQPPASGRALVFCHEFDDIPRQKAFTASLQQPFAVLVD